MQIFLSSLKILQGQFWSDSNSITNANSAVAIMPTNIETECFTCQVPFWLPNQKMVLAENCHKYYVKHWPYLFTKS